MKKITALILALVMVFALCACGNSGDNNDDAADNGVKLKILDSEYVNEDYAIAIAKDNEDLLAKVNEALQALIDDGSVKQVVDYYISGTGELPEVQKNVAADAEELIMATSADFPPYEFVDGDDTVGIDVYVASLIADKLGMKLVIDDCGFDAVIPSVVSGKADIGMAGLTVTPDRQAVVDFSTSYATGVQAIIVPENSPIASADDLFNNVGTYHVGVQLTTTGDIYCSEDLGEENVERYPKGADAVMALVANKIDCVVIDNEPAKAFVQANPGLKILETEYITEDYAIATSKSNTPLTEAVNKALEELIADGTVQSIVDKYITAE